MNKAEFNEQALYQFMLDVNEFGPQVAAGLLIKLMKGRAASYNEIING